MKLVQVSGNVFVNPAMVSCVEQRDSAGASVTYVWVGDKSYVLTVPFDEFYGSLTADTGSGNGQMWAG